jgi:hypothetical protein
MSAAHGYLLVKYLVISHHDECSKFLNSILDIFTINFVPLNYERYSLAVQLS